MPDAIKLANERGYGNLSEMIRSIKTKISELIQLHKVSMKDVYEIHPYWISKDNEENEDKIIRRSLTAQLMNTDDKTLENWPNATEWSGLRTRLLSLF